MRLTTTTIVAAACIAISGCTFARQKADRRQRAFDANGAILSEESRALTTGALDSLGYAPSNAPVAIAKRMLERDQQIEGTPNTRIDVAPLVAGERAALAALDRRLLGIDSLLVERARLQSELDAANERLQEMGRLYEAEKNRSVLRRIFGSLGITGVIAGLLALFIFFPPALAIVGRLIGWIVAKLPQAAGFLGAVGVKAYDSSVAGIERVRQKLDPEHMAVAENELSREQDKAEKRLVKTRKAVIKQV